ncbi:uncharacterized protein LOC113137916 [Mastacembelus armatus]|uniref:Uncharacterized LOC113137916 n=1 Tax=Mastacembelus armatus TaxID=205130 RepID=A0A3Q3KQJ9_9TELE|nr:uncharacterized protein LOC113137916 [Mastacembelus armatus]
MSWSHRDRLWHVDLFCKEEIKSTCDEPYPVLLLSNMNDYLLSAISFLCILPTGLQAEECWGILYRRETRYVPVGGSLSLSCVVQHCGKPWTGDWVWKNSTNEIIIKNSDRYRLTNVKLSANKTDLVLNFLRVSQLDEGSYGCNVTWRGGSNDVGHLVYVNITTAVPRRNVMHRVLVCASASLCFPIILGVARCLSSKIKPKEATRAQPLYAAVYKNRPQPPPRRPVPKKHSTFSHIVPSQQKTEVVYADISQDALRQQGATREPTQSTVYSLVKFP